MPSEAYDQGGQRDYREANPPVIIASRLDPAGMNIASQIQRLASRGASPKVIQIEDEMTSAQGLSGLLRPEPSYAIFASRHESESGLPCLTTHIPGNIGRAEHGGSPRRLSVAAPWPMKAALRGLAQFGLGLEYQVTVEATHHGPLMDIPCFFIEIGSRPENWRDPRAGEAVAQAILGSTAKAEAAGPVAVGFGGPHYSDGFTRLLLQTEYGLGHIVPKHQVDLVDEDILDQLLTRSSRRASVAILDWKGIRGDDRRKLLLLLERGGNSWVRLRDCLSRGRITNQSPI